MSKLPHPDEIRDFILNQNAPVTRREIAQAFNIKGEQPRVWLKNTLKELEQKKEIEKNTGKSYKRPSGLPDALIVQVQEITFDGEILATPVDWRGSGQAPKIHVLAKSDTQIDVGERALVRPKRNEEGEYDAKIIHILGGPEGTVVGVFGTGKDGGGIIYPADKSIKHDFYVAPADTLKAKDGDLVAGEIQKGGKGRQNNRNTARVVEVLGHQDDPKMISLIAIYHHGIPNVFPQNVVKQAEKFKVPDLGKRQDLRKIPLVTIDGADARDFDDAVFAEPDTDPNNKDGWHIIVAIADVAYYVTPGSPLDREAYKRGNSTYFPDRVVPMLPEALSNDVCSLRPHEPRACMAAHMWIDKDGNLSRYKFVRGLMQSHGRLTYEQVQAAKDGQIDNDIQPLMPHIDHLYSAFDILLAARKKRGALDLDLPERKAVINDDGHITAIVQRDRLQSHMLIEEFMVLTNVAAAMALEEQNAPCIYRVHDKPDSSKIDAAADFLSSFDIRLDKGAVMTPQRMNNILIQAKDHEHSELVSMIVLRSQAQAVYSPDNLGHFGLALERYAHFTSPIRRYADLLVHRSMVSAWNLPESGGLQPDDANLLGQQSQHISDTERRSMVAERDAMDRYTSLFLKDHVGNTFEGRIAGLNNAGLFVRLHESGADGLVPIRTLPNDYYIHNEAYHCLIGRDSGRAYRLMAPVTVKLLEADPLQGSMLFELLEYHGSPLPPKGAERSQSRGGTHGRHKGRPFQKKNEPKAGQKRKSFAKKKKKTIPKHKKKKQ